MWRSTATSFVGCRAPGSTDRLLDEGELDDRMRLNNWSIAASYDTPYLRRLRLPPHRMSEAVNVDSTLPSTCWNSHCKGARPLPSVQPSTILNARNRFQSRIPASSAVRRS